MHGGTVGYDEEFIEIVAVQRGFFCAPPMKRNLVFFKKFVVVKVNRAFGYGQGFVKKIITVIRDRHLPLNNLIRIIE